jgi:hypothetical protein
MQGLESLQLRVNLLSRRDYQGFSFLSCITGITGLKDTRLNAEMGNLVFRHLTRVTSLQHLDLRGCKVVTDSRIPDLSGLTALTSLDLDGCFHVTDSGVAHLRGLTTLRHLALNGCSCVTDSGVAHLRGLTAL